MSPNRSFLALAVAQLLVPRMAPACPLNTLDSAGQHAESSAPTWSTLFQGSQISYDLVAGTMDMVNPANGTPGNAVTLDYVVSDTYQLVGPPSATPITFVVYLDFTGGLRTNQVTLPGGGTFCEMVVFNAKLLAGTREEELTINRELYPCENFALGHAIGFYASVLPGADFPVRAHLKISETGASSTIHAKIYFQSLPHDYKFVSCQGYDPPHLPVPAVAESWGKLKHSYR